MYRVEKRYLIVDGYNFINSDDALKCHLKTSLETARQHLNDLVCEFTAYSGELGIVVYDATAGRAKTVNEEVYKNITVVFTRAQETADSYIEGMVHRLRQDKRNQVRVVTQDWAEQLVVLGSGGIRVSAREWRREIDKMKNNLATIDHTPYQKGAKRTAIDDETAQKMWLLVNKK